MLYLKFEGENLESYPHLLSILKKDAQRVHKADALRTNVMAVNAISEFLRTSFGPLGMNKAIINGAHELKVGRDGATILDNLDAEHPVARILSKAAKDQDLWIGDGVKTTVILTAELLKLSEHLINCKVHPSIIIRGFHRALREFEKVLNKSAIHIKNDEVMLGKVIAATMSCKLSDPSLAQRLSETVAMATKKLFAKGVTSLLDNVHILKYEGGNISDTVLIDGIMIHKEKVRRDMPDKLTHPKIALLNSKNLTKAKAKSDPIYRKLKFDAVIEIEKPSKLREFIDEEERIFTDAVKKIKSLGVNAIFSQKPIDPIVQHGLHRAGIFAVQLVKKDEMRKLEKITGGQIINNIKAATHDDIGKAKVIEDKAIGNTKMILVEGYEDSKSVTIFVRGGTRKVADEIEAVVCDGLKAAEVVLKDGRVVAGGGSIEVEASNQIRSFARRVGSKEQLAIEAFADAIEVIPKMLVRSAGCDVLTWLSNLRVAHNCGNTHASVDIFSKKIVDGVNSGIIEPFLVKRQAFRCAVEVATAVLRINDIVASKLKYKKTEEQRYRLDKPERPYGV